MFFYRRKFRTRAKPTDPYENSRKFFIIEAVCGTIVTNMVGGFFLSGFLAYIGTSQTLNGMIAALPIIATIFQPFGAILAGKMRNVKVYVLLCMTLQRALLAAVFIIPFIFPKPYWVIATIVLLAAAHIIGSLMSPSATDWMMRITPEQYKATFFSVREMALVACLAVVNFILGIAMNHFIKIGQDATGYKLLFACIFCFVVINTIAVSKIKKPQTGETKSINIKQMGLPFKDKTFRRVIALTCMYQFGMNTASSFWGVHQISNLKLSYLYLTILSVVALLGRVVVLRMWMLNKSKKSWSSLTVFAVFALALSHVLNALQVQQNAPWLAVIATIPSILGWAFAGMAILNMEYENISSEDRTIYVGVAAVAKGVCGMLASFLGAAILSFAETNGGINFFGINLAGQQVQMFLSAAIMAVASLLVLKQKKSGKII